MQLLHQPAFAIVRIQLDEAKVELVDRLRAPVGELGTDRHPVLRAFDLVAAEAAVVGDQLLTDGDLELRQVGPLTALEALFDRRATVAGEEPARLLRKHFAQLGLGHVDELGIPTLGHIAEVPVRVFHDVGGDVGRFLIRQAQVGHARVFPVLGRVLDPLEEPLLRDLRGDAAQVGAVLVLAALGEYRIRGRGLLAVGREVVAGEAARDAHRLATAVSIALNGDRGHGLERRAIDQVGRDRGDGGVVPLAPLDVAAGTVLGLRDRVARRVVAALDVEELRHPRGRAEGLGVRDPARDELRRELGLQVAQVRTRTALGREPVDLVAAVAAVALDELVALRDRRRVFGDELHGALVALHARGLGVLAGEHRVVPVMLLVPVVLLRPSGLLAHVGRTVVGANEVERFARAAVADRAAEFVERVRRLRAQVEIEARVRSVRLDLLLEACAIRAEVAGVAHVDALLLGEVQLEGQLVEHDLVDLQVRLHEVETRRIADDVGNLLRSAHGRAIELHEALAHLLEVARADRERLLGTVALASEIRDLDVERELLGFELLLQAHGLVHRQLDRVELVLIESRVAFLQPLLLEDVAIPVVGALLLLGRLDRVPELAAGETLALGHLGDLRLIGRHALLGLGDLLHELRFARRRAGRGQLLLHGARLRDLDLAEVALVVLPRPLPVVDHHPDDGEQDGHAGEEEPLVQRGDAVVGIATIRHGGSPRGAGRCVRFGTARSRFRR